MSFSQFDNEITHDDYVDVNSFFYQDPDCDTEHYNDLYIEQSFETYVDLEASIDLL